MRAETIALAAGGELLFVPGWIEPGEAERMFAGLRDETPWSSRTLRVAGREVREPRLTAWYGDPEARYTYSGLTLDPIPWTPLLASLRVRVEEAAGARFNSVLVNLYRDGNDSMGFHADKEPELGKSPIIASLSFGPARRFLLRAVKAALEPQKLELPLGDGALLVMRGTTQHFYRHGVPKSRAAAGPRINLTFRFIQRRYCRT